MLFSGKENIFMYLVTFQKIFWKIFSVVWRRRRKRQTRQTQKKDGTIAIDGAIAPLVDRRAERKIFSCVWLHFKKFPEKYFLLFGEEEEKDKPNKPRRRTARSHCDRRDRNRRRDRRLRSTSALVGRSHCSSIAPLVDRRARSSDYRTACRLVLSDLGSLSLSLSLSFSGNELKWKWGCKFISGSKA